MKLSKKEQIVVAVFLILVILAAGAFLFVLPEYNKIETYQNSLASLQEQRDQIYQTLSRETTIDDELQTAIDNANTFSASFYDDMTTYEADVIVREILEATNMSTDSLSIGSYTTATLTVTDYIETVVSYSLREYSGSTSDSDTDLSIEYYLDDNGMPVFNDEETSTLTDDEKSQRKEITLSAISAQQQTIGAITVSFTVEGTRGDFINFLDYIADLEKATYINSTTIAYTESSAAAATTASTETEDGEETVTAAASTSTQISDSTTVSAPISLTFYCVTPMSEEIIAEAEAVTESDTEAETEE